MITVQQPLFTHGVLNKITATCIIRTRLSQFVHDLSLSVTFSQCESHHLQEHVALLIMLSGTKYSYLKLLLLVMFLLFPFWFPLSFLPFGLLSKLEYMPKDITKLTLAVCFPNHSKTPFSFRSVACMKFWAFLFFRS